MQDKPVAHCRYLVLLLMLYMTIKLTTVVLIYKVIQIGPFQASASTLIMPLWFILGDLIAEVYGYRIARHAIWMAIICQFIFALLCTMMIHINASAAFPHQLAYEQVLGKLPRITFSSFLAIICGASVNAYAIAKWKVLLRGRYFWLRSLGASGVGELIFTLVAYVSEFWGVVPLATLLQLMTISYLTKLLFNVLLVGPCAFLAYFLKRAEGLEVYDTQTDFNFFKVGMRVPLSASATQ